MNNIDSEPAYSSVTPEAPTEPLHGESDCLNHIRKVLAMEAQGILLASENIGPEFFQALLLLAKCTGKVIVTGVGKSGLIGRKIVATLNSTGTQSVFLHPTDALHGDLGVISEKDVLLAIGKSGESDELLKLLPPVRSLGVRVLSITSQKDSSLARQSHVALVLPVDKEACPLDLAPTVSTTMTLAIGDALAMTLMKMKKFQSEDFAKFHPSGKLGKRLLLKISDVMIPYERCPVLDPDQATLQEVIVLLSRFGLGIVLFSKKDRKLLGILTDGDIRGLLDKHQSKIFDLSVPQILNSKPIVLKENCLAYEALKFMEEREKPLNVLPFMQDGKIQGVVRLHDLVNLR